MAQMWKNSQKIFAIFLFSFNNKSDFAVTFLYNIKTTPTKNAGVVLEKLI